MGAPETEKETAKEDSPPHATQLFWLLASSVLLWMAFPPVGWSLLAWVAPVGWLGWIVLPRLPGRRPYRALWLAGFLFWLLTVHWIRLPHPLNYLAWVVLAGYLGCYLPLMVALARVAVWRWHVPLWLAAPVVWTGLEWVRAHLMTGFLMGSIAHTQIRWPWVIQIGDLVGEYGVTFLVVLMAGGVTQVFSSRGKPRRFLPLVPAAVALTAAQIYGHTRIAGIALRTEDATGPRIALIQGNSLADWKSDPARQRQIMDEYLRLSIQAAKQSQEKDGRAIDLLVWPETMFRQPLYTLDEQNGPEAELVGQPALELATSEVAELARLTGAAVFVGIDRHNALAVPPSEPNGPPLYELQSYNSCLMVTREGQPVGTYDKMHRVPFGEYIPFAESIPGLYELTPLTGGIRSGKRGAGLMLDGVLYCPNICYETVFPQLIRRQVTEASESPAGGNRPPEVLINITNNAWYWGSSELDLHLACGVFRAVETRIPLVIAANGGLSAYVDATGRVRLVSGRQRPETLVVDVDVAPVGSLYLRWGDWFAVLCLLCCVVLAIFGLRGRASHSGDASHRG